MPVVKFAQKVNIMLFLLEFKEDEKQNNFFVKIQKRKLKNLLKKRKTLNLLQIRLRFKFFVF